MGVSLVPLGAWFHGKDQNQVQALGGKIKMHEANAATSPLQAQDISDHNN